LSREKIEALPDIIPGAWLSALEAKAIGYEKVIHFESSIDKIYFNQ